MFAFLKSLSLSQSLLKATTKKFNKFGKVIIRIPGQSDFTCRSSSSVEEALKTIRDTYRFEGGGIQHEDEFLLLNQTFDSQLRPNTVLSYVAGVPRQSVGTSVAPLEIPALSGQNIKLGSLERKKKLSIPRQSYHRYQFTHPPAFGDEYIVGNLNSVVSSIEDHILFCLKSGGNAKETIPFHCIINPPRHGKSLSLDRLFMKNENVLVIGITYNSTTGLVDGETNDAGSALKWFWIRVLKNMLHITSELDTLSHLISDLDQCSWENIKDLIIANVFPNPFLDRNGNEKNVLFCIDEFSVLTDQLQDWETEEQRKFISKLHQIKQAHYPFRQFVMTGFHLEMKHLLSSSSVIRRYTLELCDFSSSRPLLRKILEKYNSTQSGNFIPFPLALFEVVKSTPGLVGYWAELIQAKEYSCNIFDFSQQTNWFDNLTQVRGNSGPLKSNWILIFRYLLYFVQDSVPYGAIGDEIVAAEIGTYKLQTPEIIPICFFFISSQAYVHQIGESPVQNIILKELYELFKSLERMDPKNENKDGSFFEMLTITALHIRLLLWVQIQCGGDNPEQIVQISFRSFLPIPTAESFSGYHPQLGSRFRVHFIRSEQHLRGLLIPPLYNIFPLGVKSLEDNWDQEIHSSLKALINSKKDEYEFDKLNPLENNPLINISSKSPPKINQSIICKVKNATISTDLVFDLFNRMKSGESYEDLNETLTGNDRIWWKKLKELVGQLQTSIENDHSLISTAKGAEGADLLIAWKQHSHTFDENNVKTKEEVIHIAALELKDQRQTPLEEWEKKWNSLMSPFCILHWMPLFHPTSQFSIHLIFAGREHSKISE